jgi:hypothetical protein
MMIGGVLKTDENRSNCRKITRRKAGNEKGSPVSVSYAAYVQVVNVGEITWTRSTQSMPRRAEQQPGHSYGGYKQSGIGREFSLEGMLDSFTQRKNVTVNLNTPAR